MSIIRLLDVSGIFWPIWRKKEAMGRPVGEAASETVQTLRERAAASDVDHVVACCDSGRSFRWQIAEEYRATKPDYAGYKGHRAEKDPAMMAALDRVIDELEQDGVPILRATGFEADDVIATVTKWAVGLGHSVEVYSEDKDLLQLAKDPSADNPEAPSVIVVRRDGTRQGEEDCVRRIGVPPPLVAPFLALAGDTSDGVLGVPGVASTWATRLLWGEFDDAKQWQPTRFKSFDAIVSAAVEEQAAVEHIEQEKLRRRVETGKKKGVSDKAIAERLKITLDEVANLAVAPPLEFSADFKPFFHENVRKSLITNADNYDIGLRLTTLCDNVPLDFEMVTAPRVPKPRLDKMDPAFMTAFNEEPQMNQTTAPDAEFTAPSDPMPTTPQAPSSVVQPVQMAVQAPPEMIAVRPPQTADAALAIAQTQAMAAPNPSRDFERQLEPSNFQQAVKLAEHLASTRKLKNVDGVSDILTKMALGRSIGLNLYQSVCLFDIYEGKGAMVAQLIVARVRQHPQCEYFRKKFGDATRAVWVSKRKGQPEVEWEFTIEDAKTAKLGGIWDKEKKVYKPDFDPMSNWTKYRKQMLSWRAAVFLAREEFSEVTAGIYDPDELREQREAPAMDEAV